MDRMICEGYYRSSGRDRKRPTVTRSEKIVFSTDACVGCGVCTSVCPHGSWKVVDGHSVAEGECENCLACVHNCPQKAISIIPTPPEPEEPNRNARCPLPQPERQHSRPDQGKQPDLIFKIYEEAIVDGGRIRPQGPVNEFSALEGTSVLNYNMVPERLNLGKTFSPVHSSLSS